MEVILLERIEKLGQMGDVVNVKPGFARNYLLPRNKALRATDANRAYFETQRAQLEAENLTRRTEAEAVAGKVDGLTFAVLRQAGETGQLYGSVTARDVANAVSEAGITVGRGQVVLDTPIKTLGLHAVRVNLHPEVSVTVTANVARTEDEAAIQLERGYAVTDIDREAEEDAAEAALAAAEAALALADSETAEVEALEEVAEAEVAERAAADVEETQADEEASRTE
jgi:large subunit ribosomal protein L9